jgi:hypothetical protein
MPLRFSALAVAAILGLGALARGTNAQQDDAFNRDVAPILQKHCSDCHSEDAPEAKLNLASRHGLLFGSASGRILAPGQAKASLLLKLLAKGSKPHMPPEGQLSDAEIETISRWVDSLPPDALPKREIGPSADHWAYKPLTDLQPPAVKNEAWVANPIDRFVLAKLEASGLIPAPPADAATLCRRLYFDLVGLPPPPEVLRKFIEDFSPSPPLSVFPSSGKDGEKERRRVGESDAYEVLVESLLASPHYGERWGRHWLDLARYADSAGYHEDIDRPQAWKYRDYVIASFNADKPYGQFIAEQLAGDELAPSDAAAWIATGFCRCGPTNDGNMGQGTAKEKYRLDLLDDVVSTTSAVFLGQTIGCARCHDHKLDPILQTEYYGLLAVFDHTRRVEAELNEDGIPIVPAAPPKEAKKTPSIMALTDASGPPRQTFLLWRGDVTNRGPAVEPAVPAVMAHEPLVIPAPSPDAATTGRRLALARWIASPQNPLTWRVVANRIWRHHLGEGIVATPSNFGHSGGAPSHPELLDYLARQMLASGGSWKALHRQIVMSATYRQAHRLSERDHARAIKVDPENRLLSRANQRRLEAEALRDAVLAVAGTLNEKVGGPGIKPRIRPELLDASQRNKWPVVESEGPAHWRRSVYIYIKRQLPFPMLELFDQPNAAQTCERRDENVVPTQALVLMNDEFMAEQAGHFADRLLQDIDDDDTLLQADSAVRAALGRPAKWAEAEEASEFLHKRTEVYRRSGQDQPAAARAALADFCHVLLNCNEFAYVD